ncbi:hypothetical protein ABH926_002343 [Catenulispora sp. GP43]
MTFNGWINSYCNGAGYPPFTTAPENSHNLMSSPYKNNLMSYNWAGGACN